MLVMVFILHLLIPAYVQSICTERLSICTKGRILWWRYVIGG